MFSKKFGIVLIVIFLGIFLVVGVGHDNFLLKLLKDDVAFTVVGVTLSPDTTPPDTPLVSVYSTLCDSVAGEVILMITSEYDADIYINDQYVDTVEDSNGVMYATLPLSDGLNYFTIYAIDPYDNRSLSTEILVQCGSGGGTSGGTSGGGAGGTRFDGGSDGGGGTDDGEPGDGGTDGGGSGTDDGEPGGGGTDGGGPQEYPDISEPYFGDQDWVWDESSSIWYDSDFIETVYDGDGKVSFDWSKFQWQDYGWSYSGWEEQSDDVADPVFSVNEYVATSNWEFYEGSFSIYGHDQESVVVQGDFLFGDYAWQQQYIGLSPGMYDVAINPKAALTVIIRSVEIRQDVVVYNFGDNFEVVLGDLYDDNVINALDMAVMIDEYQSEGDYISDLTGDSVINSLDLAILISNYYMQGDDSM